MNMPNVIAPNFPVTGSRTGVAILFGGLSAGVLDIVYAIVASGLDGVPAARVLQAVASGLFGRESYAGGATTASLGLGLHMVMTTVMAALFVAASRRWPLLIERAWLSGPVYGALIYFTMRHVVVPLSAAPFPPPSAMPNIPGLLAHVFLVGLPIALFARHFAGPAATTASAPR